MSKFEVTTQCFEDLSEEEKGQVSNNGSGKEYASYIRIKRNGNTVLLENDAIEPEDTTFSRDLSWVTQWIINAYEYGKIDGEEKAWKHI